MYDYHVHTRFSADSDLPMEEAVRAAVDRGVREIAFTEHIDYFYPNCDLVFAFDAGTYAAEVDRLRAVYGDRIVIRKAVEVGLHPLACDRSRAFTQEGGFDFVIGSVHIADDLDLHGGDFFRGKTADEAVRRYLENVYERVAEYKDFHVLGHLTLVSRYLHHLGASWDQLNWLAYADRIDAILRTLIDTGRGIELNMSGYRYRIASPMPHLAVLRRYRELGGEIVTIGSDAHTADRIADRFEIGHQMLKAAGFEYLTTFESGRPSFVRIP